MDAHCKAWQKGGLGLFDCGCCCKACSLARTTPLSTESQLLVPKFLCTNTSGRADLFMNHDLACLQVGVQVPGWPPLHRCPPCQPPCALDIVQFQCIVHQVVRGSCPAALRYACRAHTRMIPEQATQQHAAVKRGTRRRFNPGCVRGL
jgi:hypothetical protein